MMQDYNTNTAVLKRPVMPFLAYHDTESSPEGSRCRYTTTTMSSRELADLTGKHHSDVMRDIRRMLSELGVGSKFAGYYTASNGKQNPCFNLPRREVDILLTGYSTTMRAAVYDRWSALEAEKKHDVISMPDTLTGALSLACELAYKLEAFEQRFAEDAEKVEFYNKIYERDGLLNPTKASKILDTGRNRLLHYLRGHKILMSRPHQQNMPYQQYLDAGYFEVKEGFYENPKTGERELQALPLLTGKGMIWLQKFIDKHGRDGL
ncbi:phage antirepressor KilAC domain-containing protein [Pseudomonas sp. Irchel 3H3]|uniref:phage antirepressor KilAC domain-containing protein n=1 Tax=Pseudomonas sp. Irchel 3H3 TaxID=2009038 RepID=UPI000BA381D0|nr:phage regulatory protein/antirepressor Ant [Pseudomonas sp. Irchel 3H3]